MVRQSAAPLDTRYYLGTYYCYFFLFISLLRLPRTLLQGSALEDSCLNYVQLLAMGYCVGTYVSMKFKVI